MVRTHQKASSSRHLLHESSDSEDSELQRDVSSTLRKSSRVTQQSQKSSNQSTTRSRKQSQPKSRQQQNANNKEIQPPRRPLPKGETPLLRDIRLLQQRTENNIIARAPFGRVLKEILQSMGDFRISKEAFDCLKEALEIYLVELFEDSYRLALHRKRVTLAPADMKLVLYIRGTKDPGYSLYNL